MSAEGSNAVFVYTGLGGKYAAQDVVRVRVDPSVTSIPAKSFHERKKLTEVELCEGLVEIGFCSFAECDNSITKINIPNSLRRIIDGAFRTSLRTPIRLHDGIAVIGEGAFGACIFTNFRVPPLITEIPKRVFYNCKSMFSLEIPENVIRIRYYSFYYCHCLRNVAFPSGSAVGDYIFFDDLNEVNTDLSELFGYSNENITDELWHRFDGLPIHKLVYYQSYNQGVLQILIAAINMRSGEGQTLLSEMDPSGNQQDCLGMTPLHILTCSSVHDLEVYRLIVEKYPANLITEDRWGALPLLYAFWGAAPTEIIQFLLDSYQSLYPGHVFNWTMMLKTMGRTDTPKESIAKLLHVKQIHFTEQLIDWDHLLDEFMRPSSFSFDGALFRERMQFLVMCGISERVECLAFKVWRECIFNMIHTAAFTWAPDYSREHLTAHNNNRSIIHAICAKLDHFDDSLPKLKNVTEVLELALWKTRINENNHEWGATHCRKRIKTNEASIRRQCRITCGADVIIGHVLPFLIPV